MNFAINRITDNLIDETLEKARQSTRKRAMHCFSDNHVSIQHMINACLHGTYMQPHKHENPDKTEIVSILRGRMAIFTFEQNGEISTCTILDDHGPNKALEIPPGTWHTMMVMDDEAVVHEIVTGPYESSTHKIFAQFSPSEDEFDEASHYLKTLANHI